MVSFHQILKKGQNIKIDIWKCPIKVELVKKSPYRAGTLQMPFEIHSNLCEPVKNELFISKSLELASSSSSLELKLILET